MDPYLCRADLPRLHWAKKHMRDLHGNWDNLTGLFIAGVRIREDGAVLSCFDTNGKPVSLKVSGTCERSFINAKESRFSGNHKRGLRQ